MMGKHLVLGLLIFMVAPLSAYQLETSEIIVSEEELYELYDNLELAQPTFEQYRFLFSQPLDLNQASFEELLALPLMTKENAAGIIQLREQGWISSPDQVEEVVDAAIWQVIKPLVFVRPRSADWRIDERFYLSDDFEDDEKGYLYNRLRAGYGKHFVMGFLVVADKEIRGFSNRDGEVYADQPLYRAAPKNAYLGLENLGPLKRLVLGSYSLRWGRGVTMNSARRQNGEGIFYYDGAGVRNQGGAVSFRLGSTVYPTLIYSCQSRKYSVSSYLDGEKATRSLPDVYQEIIWGGRLELNFGKKQVKVGITHFGEQIDPRLEVKPTGFADTSKISATGADLELQINDAVFGYEYSKLNNGEEAYYADVSVKDKRHSFYASRRHYPEKYLNPQGYGFAATDGEPNASDESGWYLKMKNRLAKQVSLQTSFDQWQHISSLITDREIAASIQAKLGSYVNTTVKYRAKDNDVLKNGSRYYYSSIKPRINLHKRLKIILYYQLREDYNVREKLDLDDNYYAQIKIKLPCSTRLTNRLKYNRTNRLSEEPALRREFSTRIDAQLTDSLTILLKATSTTKLLPLIDKKIKFKLQLDWSV